MTKRAALYHTEAVEWMTPPARPYAAVTKDARAFCKGAGWDLVATFRSVGRPGREAFPIEIGRLCRMARRGAFEAVIVADASQLLRHPERAAGVLSRLTEDGVDVVFLAEDLIIAGNGETRSPQASLAMLCAIAAEGERARARGRR